jgi:chromosomal replication initiator protein
MQPGKTPSLCVETSTTPADSKPTTVSTLPCDGPLIEAAFTELRSLLGAKRYALWFEGKIGLAIHDDSLTVAVGSPFLLNWMQKQFKDVTTEAARAVLGPSARVNFTVDATLSVGRSATETITPNETALAKVLGVTELTVPRRVSPPSVVSSASLSLNPQPSTLNHSRGRRLAELNDFIAGPQTELALTAARQVATGQPTQFNPLYIHGPVGSGKTHLLEGVCRQLKRTQPTANVMLLTSEAFANYFTQALRDRSLPSFRQRFRSVDALLVDDIEFFESKRVFQEEFLHTFAELVDHGRQVVLTGSRHPRLLTKLGDELGTR